MSTGFLSRAWRTSAATAFLFFTRARVSRERFQELVAEAYDELPPEILERIDNVALIVEDEPSQDTLVNLGLDPVEDTLFGLYEGVPVGERGMAYSALPDRIAIYYLPLTDEFHDDYHLRREIRKTIVHEVGHYFGLSEEEIARVKAGPRAPGWTAAEAVLLKASDELHQDQFISDATWTALRNNFSEKQCMDVVFTAGQYTQVSMILNTFGVQLDEGQTLDPDLKGF